MQESVEFTHLVQDCISISAETVLSVYLMVHHITPTPKTVAPDHLPLKSSKPTNAINTRGSMCRRVSCGDCGQVRILGADRSLVRRHGKIEETAGR